MPDNQTIAASRQPEMAAAPSGPQARPADPCAMVIFGAGGDLTKRLVVPALYNLSRTLVLPEKFALIGVDQAPGTAESWRDHLYETLQSFVGNSSAEFDPDRIYEAAWKRLAEKMSYIQCDLNDPGLYRTLGEHLEEVAHKHDTAGNVLFLSRGRGPVFWPGGGPAGRS